MCFFYAIIKLNIKIFTLSQKNMLNNILFMIIIIILCVKNKVVGQNNVIKKKAEKHKTFITNQPGIIRDKTMKD